MKQHLLGFQLSELNYDERLTLLSLVTGTEKAYITKEYDDGKKNEEAMLRSYGYQVNVGELIELVENYTNQFPVPLIFEGKFSITISLKDKTEDIVNLESDYQPSYCDALYEIVKKLLNDKYINL